jgi:hypothetical protein
MKNKNGNLVWPFLHLSFGLMQSSVEFSNLPNKQLSGSIFAENMYFL